MTYSKQLELENKYPDLLKKKKGSVMPFDLFGIECGDGWYVILDIAFNRINHYNNNPTLVPGKLNKIKIGVYNFFYPVVSRLPRPIQRSIYKLSSPKHYKPKNYVNARIDQVKEKFGGLRLYVEHDTPYIAGVVAFAEEMSYKICEHCGTTVGVTQNQKGWIKSLCATCHTNRREK